MLIHTTFSEFVLFLYIHMALADNYLHPSEESVILEKMSRLFPTETNHKKRFNEALAEYNNMTHDQAMELIKDTFKHFSNVKFATKYKVYTEMYDVINADGKVEESEKVVLQALKEIIDLNTK